MGVDITFLRVDKRKWEKEKLKSEEDRRNGCLFFIRETEIFNGYKSVYNLMIEIIEGFYLQKGKQLKYEKYPLLEGWEENDIILKSNDFYDLSLEFKNRIEHLKGNLTESKTSENISPNKTPEENDQFRLLDFEKDIENWIKTIKTPGYNHEYFEYVISIH